MLATSKRHRILLLAVLGVLPVVSTAPAAILNDEAAGKLLDAATWGGTAPNAGDTLNIDQFTVTTDNNPAPPNGEDDLVPDDLTFNLSGGTLYFDYDSNMTTQSATLNFNGGATFENSRGQMFYGGVTLNITGTNTYHTASTGEVSHLGSTSAALSTVVTGDGTLIKTGNGTLEIRSAANVADADSGTPGNQPRINASTFSGTYDIQAGLLEPMAPEITKAATVNLGGTVAGTVTGTNLDDSPRLNYAQGGTYAGTQLEVKNLTGTGRISWNNTGGYYRDIAIGAAISPGTANEAGLIKRNTAGSSNDLILRPDSIMTFDIFGPTQEQADQIDWTDATGTSGIVFNEANLDVRLFEPSDSTDVLSWILINGDEWITKGSQGSSSATAAASQSFANITFLDLNGDTLNLYTGVDDNDGGWSLSVDSNVGTAGSGNRQVVLTGQYFAATVPVPEPATLSVLGLGAAALLATRRRNRQDA